MKDNIEEDQKNLMTFHANEICLLDIINDSASANDSIDNYKNYF